MLTLGLHSCTSKARSFRSPNDCSSHFSIYFCSPYSLTPSLEYVKLDVVELLRACLLREKGERVEFAPSSFPGLLGQISDQKASDHQFTLLFNFLRVGSSL